MTSDLHERQAREALRELRSIAQPLNGSNDAAALRSYAKAAAARISAMGAEEYPDPCGSLCLDCAGLGTVSCDCGEASKPCPSCDGVGVIPPVGEAEALTNPVRHEHIANFWRERWQQRGIRCVVVKEPGGWVVRCDP